MVYILISGIVSLIVIIIFSVSYRHKSKVDKGPKLNYFSLSYRRKMIRTLMTFPVVILAVIAILLFPNFSIRIEMLFVIFLLLVFVIQLIYNFYMWKKKEE